MTVTTYDEFRTAVAPPDARRVLVVEDARGVGSLIRTVLEWDGWQVLLTQTAKRALALVEGLHLDVAVVDLGLPDSIELEHVRRLRVAAPELPIVIMTGQELADETSSQLESMGVKWVLDKPFELDVLTAVVASAASERQRLAGESLGSRAG